MRGIAPPKYDFPLSHSIVGDDISCPYGNQVTIATTNVGHLSRFVDACEWQDI